MIRRIKKWFAKNLQDVVAWSLGLVRGWLQEIITSLEELEAECAEELERWVG